VIELALSVPLLMVFVLGVVQVAGVTRDQLAVQLAAREGARAAAVSADPAAAAEHAATVAVTLRPLSVATNVGGGTVTVTVRHANATDVPIVGSLLPTVDVSASTTMALEPP
jgi:Flp pilus assembly protein TadG